MKNEQEMLDYIELFITQQGNEGAMKISPLLIAMVERLFAEPITGVTPIVVNIDKQGKVEGTSLSLAFKGCKVLHTFKIKGLNSNIDLSDCPMLSKETVEYLVENSGAKPFTIMLHTEVRNNINNDNLWADVKGLIKSKSNITIA